MVAVTVKHIIIAIVRGVFNTPVAPNADMQVAGNVLTFLVIKIC
jgi:hypothetical protein